MDVRGAGGHVDGQADTWWEGPLPAAPRRVGRREGGVALKRTRLQDWVLVNRKGIFTEHALLLLPERLLADVSAAGLHPAAPQG